MGGFFQLDYSGANPQGVGNDLMRSKVGILINKEKFEEFAKTKSIFELVSKKKR